MGGVGAVRQLPPNKVAKFDLKLANTYSVKIKEKKSKIFFNLEELITEKSGKIDFFRPLPYLSIAPSPFRNPRMFSRDLNQMASNI